MIRFKILCGLLFAVCTYSFVIQPITEILSALQTTSLSNVIPEKATVNLPPLLILKPNNIDLSGNEIGVNTKEPGEIRIVSSYEQPQSIIFTPTKGDNFTQKNNTLLAINLTSVFGGLIIVALGISIFVLFIKVINAFRKSEIFDKGILSKISWIGISLILMGIVQAIMAYITLTLANQFIAVDGYTLISPVAEWNMIIFGISILVLNEILRVATTIKEEQDLTI